MRIALLIIILSKEKAGGSGLIFFLFLSLPSLACKVLANILATQFKDPMSALVSNVTQQSPAVVTCQQPMLGISQMYLLYPRCASPSVLRKRYRCSLVGKESAGAANMCLLAALASNRLECAAFPE